VDETASSTRQHTFCDFGGVGAGRALIGGRVVQGASASSQSLWAAKKTGATETTAISNNPVHTL
jgi:hypothetical protein